MKAGLFSTNIYDAGPKFFDLLKADSVDHLKFGEGAGALDRDVAEGGGPENKELRKAETFCFRGAPVAEALIEKLLGGGEWVFFWFRSGMGRGAELLWCGMMLSRYRDLSAPASDKAARLRSR